MQQYDDVQFELYIERMIGNIDCGDPDDLANSIIYKLELARKHQSMLMIKSILKNIPKEKLIYVYCRQLRGIAHLDDIDILDLDILINNSVLGVFYTTKSKTMACLKHYSDMVICTDAYSVKLNHQTIERVKCYQQQLDALINVRQEEIEKLMTTCEPNYNFINRLDVPKINVYDI